MKCTKCNFLNAEQNRVCSQCGESLEFTTPIRRSIIPVSNLPDIILNPGECFGSRYQIIEQIGAGGMGRVFKALDKELNIPVVLKFINPELNNGPDALERFKRELLLAREIIHENVIRIHDLGETNGIHYISMNYVEGQNLQELIGMAGPLSVEKVLDIIVKICQALVTAHAKGIIHRDLKPQNVMIGKKGMVTVLDFGIARSVEQSGTTRSGIIIGTPECMSPEQIQGETVDASTDIYSLGIMMYQMVTGRLPFLADNTAALLLKHLHETPPPPSSINRSVPKALERIILKCLEKKPGKRYASVVKLLESVKRLLKKKARQESRKRRLLPLRRALRLQPLVFLGRLLELLILFFAIGTLIGWFLDFRFNSKLQQLTLEYPLYFKTHFPLDKDYLPDDWPARPGNAWEVYRRAMARTAEQPGSELRLRQAMEKLYRTAVTSNNLEGVTKSLEKIGAEMKLGEMLSGIARDKLAAIPGNPLSGPLVAAFSRWQALRARLGFLSGDIAAGVARLRELGYFLVDCEAAAGGMSEQALATGQFEIFCRELIPMLLADDIDPAQKQLEKIEPLLLLFLKKMSAQRFFQMAYMDDLQAVRQGNYNENWWTGPGYFWFGRFRFLIQKSSRNMHLFKALADESKARDELDSISDPDQIREILARLRHDDGKDWPQVGSSRFASRLNSLLAGRTLIKLALLLERRQRFGLNAAEVTALRNSDLGINDLSGEPLKITGEAGKSVVRLTAQTAFEIKPMAYAPDHTAIIADWEKIAAAIGAMDHPGQ
jgi:serine/threonine protein kinase